MKECFDKPVEYICGCCGKHYPSFEDGIMDESLEGDGSPDNWECWECCQRIWGGGVEECGC